MIKVYDQKQYNIKQSKYDVPKTPFRQLLLAQSNSGKTNLISNMIINFYDKVFERIYIFSHSINIDAAWEPVKQYLSKNYDESHYKLFDKWDEKEITDIVHMQEKAIEQLKKRNHKDMYQILIVLDDVMDDKKLMRSSELLTKLFIRGRHSYINVIASVQKYKSLNPTIRMNTSDDIVFKLRSKMDLDALIDEYTALASKKELLQYYKKATDEPFGFLWINKTSRSGNLDDLFKIGFNK